MADKRNIHQSWDAERQQWRVSRAGSDRASSYHDKEAQARDKSQGTAKRDKVEWIKHKKDNGQIHERNTYGKDPYPPKG